MKPLRYAATLSSGYGLLVAAYIWISGTLAAESAGSLEQLERFERIKGLLFVLVTSLLLFVASLAMLRRLQLAVQERAQERNAILLAQSRIVAGELAAALAHDFNNMLTVIGASLEQLSAEADDPDSLEDARLALARGSELALRLARTARGHRDTQLQSQDVGELVRTTVQVLSRLPKLRTCKLEVSCSSDGFAQVNGTLFEQLVVNLLLNAAEAAGVRGRIQVRFTGETDSVRLEVHDDGPGIPAAERDAMFSAFVTTKSNGLGLGLLSVKATVEAHDGTIRVSDSPIGGACFIVTIPRHRIHPGSAPTAK